jgi:hypothetical protein
MLRNTCSLGKSERHMRKWEDNIKSGLKEIRWGVGDCLNLAPDMNQWQAIVNTTLNNGVQ